MKKLLKNEICGSVKHKKSNISAKKKNRRNAKRAFRKRKRASQTDP